VWENTRVWEMQQFADSIRVVSKKTIKNEANLEDIQDFSMTDKKITFITVK
jgi:hypothetical protein